MLYPHVYIHLPFCEVICHYCDFYTARAKEARHEELIDAIILEANSWKEEIAAPLKTIYFGGGTPSVTPAGLLERLLKTLPVDKNTEITLEANPTNINEENLHAWKKIGINRLSIGIQSLNDRILRSIGRMHNTKDASAAVSLAKKYFENISCDLMYGIPEQSTDDLLAAAGVLLDIGITHLSAYHLTLDQKHFWASKVPHNDICYQQIEALYHFLEAKKFQQYEVSNFSMLGFESKHNQCYWKSAPYLGFGPSAHSFDGGEKRWKNIPHWKEYCEKILAGKAIIFEEESLDPKKRQIEVLFTSLRTTAGLDVSDFKQRFARDFSKQAEFIKALENQGLGLISTIPARLQLSFKGRMLADEIVQKLL